MLEWPKIIGPLPFDWGGTVVGAAGGFRVLDVRRANKAATRSPAGWKPSRGGRLSASTSNSEGPTKPTAPCHGVGPEKAPAITGSAIRQGISKRATTRIRCLFMAVFRVDKFYPVPSTEAMC